jgi:Zn-dependent protease with chaperone function
MKNHSQGEIPGMDSLEGIVSLEPRGSRETAHRDLEGYYLSGQSATRQRAMVIILRDGIHITTESGEIRWWPYREIHQSQKCCAEEQIRLERGGPIPEVLLLPSHSFFEELKKIGPIPPRQFQKSPPRSRRIFISLLAAIALVFIVGGLYFRGIPVLTRVVASYVPVSWEEHLGEAMLAQIAPESRRCFDPSGSQILDRICKVLLTAAPENPYRFKMIVVNDRMINALALPGGFIILFQGLLERTDGPEELAGVLAHELQHILLRHSTQALLQEASLGLLVAAMTGDTRGIMNLGLEGARALGAMHYSRQAEEEADAGAVQMLLQSGIGTEGMIAFFEKLKKSQGKTPNPPPYLSSHPKLEDRIERLMRLSREGPRRPKKPIVVGPWNRIRYFCSVDGGHSVSPISPKGALAFP